MTEINFFHIIKVNVTETSFFLTKKFEREKNSFRKPFLITETNFCPSFRQRNTLLSQLNSVCHRKKMPPISLFLSRICTIKIDSFLRKISNGITEENYFVEPWCGGAGLHKIFVVRDRNVLPINCP